MNKEINTQQEQTLEDVNAQNPSVDTENKGTAESTQDQNGRWESVDPNNLGFTVSGDMNKPILGPDGSYYCISNSNPEYNSIQANQSNAVPTPASIVQLPPIVQPIALVPFASQNQPLLQYDPNFRPTEPQTDYSPKYRLKPYRGISFVQLLCSIAVIVLLVLFAVIGGKKVSGGLIDWSVYNSTGLDTIYGVLALFGLATSPSAYYDNILKLHFADGIDGAFSSDFLLSLMYILIPIFITVIILISIILILVFLIKMGKLKTPRGFNLGALINLLLAIACIAMITIISKRESLEIVPGIMLYVVAGISAFMIIFPYFAKKNAYIIDESALKRVYILDDNN